MARLSRHQPHARKYTRTKTAQRRRITISTTSARVRLRHASLSRRMASSVFLLQLTDSHRTTLHPATGTCTISATRFFASSLRLRHYAPSMPVQAQSVEYDSMFGIGFPELVVILVVCLVIFGPGKLPELGEALGKGIRDFQRALRQPPELDVTP